MDGKRVRAKERVGMVYWDEFAMVLSNYFVSGGRYVPSKKLQVLRK